MGVWGRKNFFLKKVFIPQNKHKPKKGEPPTRVLPLSLHAKKFTLSCVLGRIRGVSPIAMGDKGSAPLTCAAF